MLDPKQELLIAHLDVVEIGGPKHRDGDSPEYNEMRIGLTEDNLCDFGFGRQEIEEASVVARIEAEWIKENLETGL